MTRTTGQYPRRRESDKAAQKRAEELERRAREYRARGVPITHFIWAASLPRISASGRLIQGAL